MRAEPSQQLRLLDLQALDTALLQLDRRERDLPERSAAAEAAQRLDGLRAAAAERLGAVEDARAELGRLEADAAVVAGRIARDDELLLHSASVKDVQGLEGELATLRRRQAELEEAQFEVLERLEEAELALTGADAEREALVAEHARLDAVLQAVLAEIAAERAARRSEREALVAALPQELVELYEQRRARYGVGASRLSGAVTSASGVTLTAVDLAAVRAAAPDEVVFCPDSNAILIRAEA